jgi:hypothetical protein
LIRDSFFQAFESSEKLDEADGKFKMRMVHAVKTGEIGKWEKGIFFRLYASLHGIWVLEKMNEIGASQLQIMTDETVQIGALARTPVSRSASPVAVPMCM